MKNQKNINFRKMFNSQLELTQIINQLDQEQYEIDDFLFDYEKNNRQGAVLKAKDVKTGDLQKIIIDSINGEPNSDQVKAVTFGQGAGCDKRIILYSSENPGYIKNNYRHEREMMEGFIKVNNDCGHDTYLIKVSLAADETYKYEFEMSPSDKKYTAIRRLPSKQEFEQAVFKVFYNQTDFFGGYEHEEHMKNIDNWFDGTYWVLEMNEISFRYPVWNEQGLFIYAVSMSDNGVDNLLSMKKNNLETLEKYFVNREIRFDKNVTGELVMSIKLWEQPLSYFNKQSSKEKERIVQYLRDRDSLFCEIWDHKLYLKEPEDEDFITAENTFRELKTAA